jgi:hypothetical protein
MSGHRLHHSQVRAVVEQIGDEATFYYLCNAQ